MKVRFHYTAAIIFAIVCSSCVTTKKSKQEVGFVGKKYHDLTAKFNGLFNAREIYDASVVQLESQHEDNYNQILSLYPHESVENPKSVEADMDKVIEKATKVSTLHEVSKWVDDCYVLMGKAQYLKGDYESSEETFAYFVDDFNPTDPDSRVYQTPDKKGEAKARKKEIERERKIKEEERDKVKKQREEARKEEQKKRKKSKKSRNKRDNRNTKSTKEEKTEVEEAPAPAIEGIASSDNEQIPLSDDELYLQTIEKSSVSQKDIDKINSGGFLKHRPAYYEGMLWLAKAYIKREKWLDAKYYLDRIVSEGRASEEVLRELSVVRADMLLKMKDYSNALPVLNEAIEISKDRKQKARMAYIMAQIYQMRGESAQAAEAFVRVSKFRPGYEMELNAELSQLKNDWASGKSTSNQAISRLEKLLKEGKNLSYLGSIYFTMAEIQLADGQEGKALENFNLALQNSAGGNKTAIYYRLATLFLGNERYLEAKNYFDSTLTVMSKKDERYLIAQRYSNNLRSIAQNISVIQLQDSLLRLGALSEDELKAFALEKVKAEEALKSAENTDSEDQIKTTAALISGNSRFFAYNQAALQKGRQDFNKRWGGRLLEDNWRRSNKSSSLIEAEEENQTAAAEPEKDYSKEIEKIIRTIPTTEDKKSVARTQMEKAMFELGTGFRTYLENFQKSNETLTNLLEQFPATKNRVEAYYYMHLNYVSLDNPDQAQRYYDLIIREFPESPYAIYLQDPTNDRALMTEERKISLYYDNTYLEFERGNYQLVFDRLENARQEFGQNQPMAAKYDLLRAMAIGNLQGQTEYINALRGVILKYNNTPEQTLAKEMLRFLRGDEEAFGKEVSETDLSKFKIEDDKLHYIIVLLYNGDGGAVNDAKIQINDFNEKYFSDWRLRSTSMFLNQEQNTHLILLRRFQDKEQAMEFYNKYASVQNEMLDTQKFSYDVFAINQLNYREIITSKSANAYRLFFDSHYLGK